MTHRCASALTLLGLAGCASDPAPHASESEPNTGSSADTAPADATPSGSDIHSDASDAVPQADVSPEPLRDWVAFMVAISGSLDRVGLAPANGESPPVMLPVDGPFNALRQPSFRPDGTSLLYVSVTQSTTELRAFEFATGLVEVYIPDKFAALQFPQWSPDGTRVVVRAKVTNEDDWTHWIWDSRDDSLVEVFADDVEESIVSALSWSCDGESFFHVRGTGGFGGITDVWEMATDGSQGGQLTFGMIPSTISIRVSPDCDEVLIDSLSEGRSLRVGTLSEPPSGSLARGFTSPLSAEDSYANCDYLVGSRYVCERLSGPGAEFDSCDEGSSQCVLDIVVLDSSGEATNITRSLEIRETFPVASRLAADFQP